MPPTQGIAGTQLHDPSIQNQTRHTEQNQELSTKGPTFNGKSSFKDFIVQFDCISEIRGWTDAIKGQRLLMALEGQAVGVLGTLPAGVRTHYASLREALEKRFDPQLDSDLAGTLAQTRRRRRGESFVAFVQELKKLMNLFLLMTKRQNQ